MTNPKGKKPKQLALDLRTWGGKRRGAGRKRKGPRPNVTHAPRERFSRWTAVHVTMRLGPDIWSLRSGRMFRSLRWAFRMQLSSVLARLRIVHFAVLRGHIHAIVEVEDSAALSTGMKGLSVRIAHAVNRRMQRRGQVIADRFHSTVLHSPRQIRNAVAYVLGNHASHSRRLGIDAPLVVDAYSSACGDARIIAGGPAAMPAIGFLLSRHSPRPCALPAGSPLRLH